MLSGRVPDLADLEVLLAVVATGSMNAAAPELGVSQQAVSARIAAMERRTGLRLLDRSRRGTVLTPAGTVVSEWAARVLDAAGQLDVGIAALRAGRDSRLRIAASLTVAEYLLPGWLVSYQASERARGATPATTTLTAANSVVVAAAVLDGSADVGFVESPTAPRGLRSRVVGHDTLVLVAPPGHPLTRRRRPVTTAELAGMSLVSREPGSGTRDALQAALQAALRAAPGTGRAPEPAPPLLELSSTSAIRAAVHAGAGPAVLSELAVAEDAAAGRVVPVPVAGPDLRRVLRAVWTGAATPPAGPVRDLIAHIAAVRRS